MTTPPKKPKAPRKWVPPLEGLSAGSETYFENEAHDVHLFEYGKSHGNKVLSDNGRLVLALNDACCKAKSGKVYQVLATPKTYAGSNDHPVQREASRRLVPLPGLCFTPCYWSDQQQRDWLAMEPSEQLQRSWSPHGWIHEDVPVLPFGLVITTGHKWPVRRFIEQQNCSVLALITPRAYLGKTIDFTSACLRLHPGDDVNLSACIREQLNSGAEDWFADLRVNGVEGMRQALLDLYQDSPELLQCYADVEARIAQAHREASTFWNADAEEQATEGEVQN